MNNYAANNLKLILFSICSCMILSCSSQKDNATNRSLQNLSARYNYIYNSNVILTNHQNELAETYAENYDLVLPVYLAPEVDLSEANVSLGLKPMEDIIKKAQAIILDKSYSNYIDESYLLLGKANFYNGNYFNAAEYFDYTAKTYRNNLNSFLEALDWKARSLMQLRRLSEANKVLDSLEYILPDIKKRKYRAQPLATLAQMCIYLGNDTAAVAYLKDAIRSSNQSQHKIRWTYILAQLYEKNKDYQSALASYKKVAKSNAPFEMYFNANLNRIKINASQNGIKVNKQKELLALLKDDKNLDYSDQVYFQIAETYAADGDYTEAEKYYHIAVKNSSANQYQKGLSYLKIADLNFRYLKNYLKAKTYYDSTVNILPKNYPGYELILKKTLNLQYLTDRYETIALQDSLQAIAKLPEAARIAKIEALASPAIQATAPINTNNGPVNQINYTSGNTRLSGQATFYFSNPTAVSLGFSDFKKRWGNRKLENNWRQSIRTSAQETTQDLANNINGLPLNPDQTTALPKDKEALIRQYTESLPLSPELMSSSNQKIIDAYYEIASFYLQELNDPEEADVVYQTLLKRFPANNHLAASWYGLFLIHKDTDPAKSLSYKNSLLKEFPNSPYSRILLDPSFSLKQSEMETAVNKKYNDVFEQYTKKDFSNVIRQVNETTREIGSNHLAPQFAYLKAISIGRSNNVDSLLNAFDLIVRQFPEDQLITPLVKEHIAYISSHLTDYQGRPIALPDFDPNESPINNNISTPKRTEPAPALVQNNTTKTVIAAKPVTVPQKEAENSSVQPKTIEKIPDTPKPVTPEKKSFAPFTDAKSSTYYYVIHVADASLTLSSSRFGIGQFNRGNYAENNLRHQLKEFDNDQLIYVGNFVNFEEAKTYASGITPQLKQIMKVPVNIYTNFIISKENFDLIKSKALLDTYLEFYKNNY